MPNRRSCLHVIFFLVSATLNQQVLAAQMLISWAGEITSVTEFSAGSLPGPIAVGDPVSGTLRFERSAYDQSSDWLGTAQYGQKYRYQQGLHQSVRIRDLNWVVESGTVSLMEYYPFPPFWLPRQSFDAFSTSEDGGGYTSFPNFVGDYSMGFALIDLTEPLNLFDTQELESANFSLQEFNQAIGSIASRAWEGAEIVNGYYFEFDVASVEITAAPLPAPAAVPVSTWQFLLGLAGLIMVAVRLTLRKQAHPG